MHLWFWFCLPGATGAELTGCVGGADVCHRIFLSAGGPIVAAELERSRPYHVRRTGSGRNLQGSSGQKREDAVPAGPCPAHHKTPRRALRLQGTHLCERAWTHRNWWRWRNAVFTSGFTSAFSAPLWCWSRAPKTLWASASPTTNIPNSPTQSRWVAPAQVSHRSSHDVTHLTFPVLLGVWSTELETFGFHLVNKRHQNARKDYLIKLRFISLFQLCATKTINRELPAHNCQSLFSGINAKAFTQTGFVFQAKTVEEKKLWAHHIKRIILENHHAVIPQKVGDQRHHCRPAYINLHHYTPEYTCKH